VKASAISIVEAAYDCGSDTRGWLGRLLDEAIPRLDRGFGICASTYHRGIALDEVILESRQMTGDFSRALIAMCTAHEEIFHRLNGSGPPIGTVTQILRMTAEQAETWRPYVDYMHPLGVRDLAGLVARDPSGHAITFTVPLADFRRPTRPEIATWSRIAAHITAGARLRRALCGAPHEDWADGADAVLSPSGSIAHAEMPAQGPIARDSLRRAAKAIDRARSRARSNEDEALDLWQGLVAGRWSLVEHFDSDGRRFLVARKNDPHVKDPRALTLRERQVLAYVAMGHPIKLIAYSLGVSPSSVSVSRRIAMRKLALRSTTDVVRLFQPAPPSESEPR
jgi:DNA-binding CsgD family transcriptional regulator